MKNSYRLIAGFLIAVAASTAITAAEQAPPPREVTQVVAKPKVTKNSPKVSPLKSDAKNDQKPSATKIRFPTVAEPVPPAPMPPPPPKVVEVPVLLPDNLYVVDSDVELIVVEAPEGMLKISSMDGPVTIRSKFIDGDRVETRTFRGKNVYLVEGAKSGNAELLVLPVGGKQADLMRKRLVVQTTPGPAPPGPTPPGPTPDPNPLPITGFRVIFVSETNPSPKYNQEQNNILSSTAIATYLNAKCIKGAKGQPEWRRWDKDIKPEEMKKETETLQKLWEATKPRLNDPKNPVKLPAMVVVNDRNGEVIPIPDTATEADILAMLKKFGGN